MISQTWEAQAANSAQIDAFGNISKFMRTLEADSIHNPNELHNLQSQALMRFAPWHDLWAARIQEIAHKPTRGNESESSVLHNLDPSI